jgi:hypothetical protein
LSGTGGESSDEDKLSDEEDSGGGVSRERDAEVAGVAGQVGEGGGGASERRGLLLC